MYQPAHFVESRPEVLRRLVHEHPFGLLVTQDAKGITANSVPFFLDDDPAGGPGVLRAHVARANPVWREARADVESLVVFQGAQGYVSPAWRRRRAATPRRHAIARPMPPAARPSSVRTARWPCASTRRSGR